MLGWLGTLRACVGARAALRAPPSLAWIPALGVAWLVLALGLWTAFGLVAGVPLDALALACDRDDRGRPRRRSTRTLRQDAHLMAQTALVTGGAGLHRLEPRPQLCSTRGDDVRVLDNFSTGNRANLEGLDVEIVEGELRSYERVHNAVRGADVVYHLGALGSVPRSVQDPLTSSAVNIEGTLNVLLAARDEGIRRVVFSSSTSVYGSSRQLPTTEDTPPDPISPYGVAKLAAERYCVSFSRVYDSLETVVLRYFNVFGPRQSPLSQYAAVVPLFVTAIAAGSPVQIHGDGEQSRDFTYVGNVVDATLRAGRGRRSERRDLQHRKRHSGNRQPLADTIGTILGKPVLREHVRTAGRRHPRLVGRPEQGRAHPRLPARDRPGRGPASHGRVSQWLTRRNESDRSKFCA